MKTMKTIATLVASTFVLVTAMQAQAAKWKVEFEGNLSTITEYNQSIHVDNSGYYDFHNGRFDVTNPVYLTMVIDDEMLPSPVLADNTAKDIYNAASEVYYDINGYEYRQGVSQDGFVQIWNDDPGYFSDVLLLGSNTSERPFDMGEGNDISSFSLHMYNTDGVIFSSTDLRSTLDTLSQTEGVAAYFQNSGITFSHQSAGNEYEPAHYLNMTARFTDVVVTEVVEAVEEPVLEEVILATLPTAEDEVFSCEAEVVVEEQIVYVEVEVEVEKIVYVEVEVEVEKIVYVYRGKGGKHNRDRNTNRASEMANNNASFIRNAR